MADENALANPSGGAARRRRLVAAGEGWRACPCRGLALQGHNFIKHYKRSPLKYVRQRYGEKKTSTKRVIHWEWGVMSGWCHFDPDKLCYLPGPRTSLGSYYLKEAPPPLGMSLQEWLTRLGIPLNKEIVTSLPLSPSVWSQTETPPGGSGCQRRENKYLFKALLTAPETLQLHYTTSISFIHRPRHCQEALECKIQPQSKADKGYKIKFIVTPYTRRNRGAPIVPRP